MAVNGLPGPFLDKGGKDANTLGYNLQCDGSDETALFASIVTAAKAANAPIWIKPNAGSTLKISPAATIDLTGIPSIDSPGVEIDLSDATASYPLEVRGTRALVAGPVAVSPGAAISATVATSSLTTGDILVLVSNEYPDFTASGTSRKGSRHHVISNDGAGAIRVSPAVPWTYTAAYLYRIDEARFTLGAGVTLVGPGSAANSSALQAVFARMDVLGKARGWGGSCFRWITASGSLHGPTEDNPTDFGLGYGASINDLSEVQVSAQLHGARHAVASGGGTGEWTQADVGGSSGSLSLPSSYTLSGGHYSSAELRALDSHAITHRSIMADCVAAGVQAHARTARVTGVLIPMTQDQADAWGLLCAGSHLDWNDFEARGVTVEGLGVHAGTAGLVGMTGPTRRYHLYDVDVSGDWSSTGSSRYPVYISDRSRDLRIERLRARRGATTPNSDAIRILAYADCIYELHDIDAGAHRIYIEAQEAGVRVRLVRPRITAGFGTGLWMVGTTPTDGFTQIEIIDPEIEGCQLNGLFIQRALRVDISGGYIRNNGQDGVSASASRAAIQMSQVQRAHLRGVDLTGDGDQTRPLTQSAHPSGTSVLSLVDCDLRGNGTLTPSLTSVTYIARRGNIGGAAERDYVLDSAGVLRYYDTGTSAWVTV